MWFARRSGRNVAAIKVLKRAKGSSLARFEDEILAQKQLTGTPGVLPLVDCYLDSDPDAIRPWLATPVAETLEDALSSENRFDDVLECMTAVAKALAEVHGRGFAHRDVKPENIFRRGGCWEIGDFGLVDFAKKREMTSNLTKLGPMYYIAPEMLSDPAGSDGMRADVFSFAKTLWVLATGQRYPAPGQLRTDVEALKLSSYVSGTETASLHLMLQQATSFEPENRPHMHEVHAVLAAFERDRRKASD